MCRGCVPAVRKAQPAVIWRVEKDGTRSVVACVDDKREIGVEIYADRDKIDWEPAGYDVEYGDGDDLIRQPAADTFPMGEGTE